MSTERQNMPLNESDEDQVRRMLRTNESTMDDAAHNAKKATDDAAGRAHRAVDKAAENAKSAVDSITSKTQDTAENVTQTARNVADTVTTKASEVGEQANEQLDRTMTAAGSQLKTLAGTVRERAPEGKVGELASNAAVALERSGECLSSSYASPALRA
ncbi:hypothetical protein HC891_22825 [Candidatus Gracilibacteria bacterium]|nr:hypothetical protein [Candidatus Gracilibacteria bacterium]